MREINRALSLIIMLCLLVPQNGGAAPLFAKGIFGVPSVAGMPAAKRADLLEALRGVDTVFTPAEAETISFFKSRGFRVFLTANAFGGTAAWKEFPDARPVLADGRRMGEAPGPAAVFPGAPAVADSAALADEIGHGGVCPTHAGWRAARLREIGDQLTRFSGRDGGIDGIWLDFIRYPGVWENRGTLAIPDACYCPRCLAKFSRDTGITLPVAPENARDAAAWLRQNRPYEWMAWKKEQITSFARDVRTLIENRGDMAAPPFSSGKNRGAVPPLLGAFVVPWTKGERDGAVSFLLGQDAFALAETVDVLSPMLYHRMVGRDANWVGDMTEYCLEQTRCAVWPIIQAEETTEAEFAKAVRYAGLGGAAGLLVYSQRGMNEGKRQALAAFRPPENLIPNPEFRTKQEAVEPAGSHAQRGPVAAAPGGEVPASFVPKVPVAASGSTPSAAPSFKVPSPVAAAKESPAAVSAYAPRRGSVPLFWSMEGAEAGSSAHGPRYGLVPASDLLPATGKGAPLFPPGENRGSVPIFLAAKGGTEASGEWRAPLPACEPGQVYRMSCLFHRDTWNDLSYSYVSVWGQRYLLEKHAPRHAFQPLRVKMVCPSAPRDDFFRFTNEVPDDYFYLAAPRLVRGLPLPAPAPAPHNGFFYPGFFPIGIYGADAGNLNELRKLALNTVIIGGEGDRLGKTVASCRKKGLRYVLSPPNDPERLKVYLDRLSQMGVGADDSHLAFYVDDEPEMRAVPAGRAEDVQRLVKGRFPRASTGMATVRPSYCREYLRASDFFMIDNYPFPDMPMSWLGDSLDRAAEEAGRDRLLSVIQAFSDGDYWPSLPGWRQMDCLAFLSIVHGSRGIFFYTWSVIGKTAEGRANLGRVVGRLNKIYPWLLEKNLMATVGVEMLSEHRMDPKGRPGVHACLKRKGDELMLIAVNTLGAPVEARLKLNRGTAPPFPPAISPGKTGTEPHSLNEKRGRSPSFSPNIPGAFQKNPGAIPPLGEVAREAFSGTAYPVREGAIRTTLKAYETKAFILKKE